MRMEKKRWYRPDGQKTLDVLSLKIYFNRVLIPASRVQIRTFSHFSLPANFPNLFPLIFPKFSRKK